MLTIIALYLLGLIGVVGCFFGATHHAVTAAVCIIFATLFLLDYLEDRKELRR